MEMMLSKCRACLGSSDKMKYVSKTNSECKNLILMFTSVTAFEWIDNETVAPFLCNECESTLESAYKFQKKCQRSSEILENFLQTVSQETKQFFGKNWSFDECNKTIKSSTTEICDKKKIQDENIDKKTVYFCKQCNKNVSISPTDHVIVHENETFKENKEEKNISCEICMKNFRHKRYLRVHMSIHTGETPHLCSFCEKRFRSKTRLLDHERVHTGEKAYICNFCGKNFSRSGTLETHIRQHTGRPEECHICQKRFCRPSELKRHLKKHSGERPFLCAECGKAFLQKSHLIEHSRTHSEQRPYKCNFCEKSFKQKSWLTSHLRLHSVDKRFKCTLCLYTSPRRYRLQEHMKKHKKDGKCEKNDKEIKCLV